MLNLEHPKFTCNKIQVVMFSRSPSARNILNMQNRTEQNRFPIFIFHRLEIILLNNNNKQY